MKLTRLLIALSLLLATPALAGMQIGPITTGSPQTGGSGTAPVVTSFTCNAVLPVANGVNVSLLAGGACGYTATCAGAACTGINAITAWAITGQSTANSYSIVSGTGILQGGSAAAAVTAATYTVTVTATNSTGTSPGVTQSVVVANTKPTVASHTCAINLPVTNGVSVSPSCSYTALCDAQACVSPYALTNWAITSQSVANGFSITSAGVLQGGSGAASVVVGSPTVTITATNGAGTSSGVTQTVTVSPAPSGVAPVVTALACTISSPVTNGANVARSQRSGNCAYSATCSGGTCTGGNAITGWAITAQSCVSCYSITSGGVLQGGANAANVATETDTVTVTATNSTGTSPGVSQTVNSFADGAIGAPVVTTIQFANAFNGGGYTGQSWATRPPWSVAGVDYPVGIPTAVTLIDWQTIVGAGGTGPNTLTTNGATASGNVLHFASTSGVLIGMPVTGTNIPGATLITGYTPTTITISNNVTGGGVANSATITINSGGSAVGVSGFNFSVNSNNVVVDSIDFSLHNGAQIIVHGSGVTIQNSNLFFGTNCSTSCNQIVNFVSGATNGTLLNNIIDGNGINQGTSSAQSTLINFSGGGSMTMKYNYFRNFLAHVIEYDTGTALVYDYNLVYNVTCNGACGTPHSNFLQWGTGDQGTASVMFNFGYQPNDAGVGGQGFQFTPNSVVGALSFVFANNTLIYSPSGVGITDAHGNVSNQTGLIYNNYIDSRGNNFFFPDSTACPLGASLNKYGAACSSGNASNINPVTGATITTTP